MKILGITVLMSVAFWVNAEEPELSIDGAVEMNITANQMVNASIGVDSTASQAVGAIESGDLSGEIEIGIQASQDVNAAIGDGACADQQIGTIGKKSSC